MNRLATLALFVACGSSNPRETLAAEPVEGAVFEDEPLVGTWSQGEVSESELDAIVATELQNLQAQFLMDQYELRSEALSNYLDEKILLAEAEAEELDSINTLLKIKIEDQVPKPSKADVKEYFKVVQRHLPGRSFDEVRQDLSAQLRQERMGEKFGSYIALLREKYQANSVLPYPDLPRVEIPLDAADPAMGKENAPVTIVEFGEYECYFCASVMPTLDQLLEAYPDDIRIVFKDFPLGNHTRAMPAAQAAHCSGEQGKYWEMNRQMLSNQGELEDSHFMSYAQKIGLDVDAFEKCYRSGRHEITVSSNQALGEVIGVQATPTFFVNGLLLSGAQPYERFVSIIEGEIKE